MWPAANHTNSSPILVVWAAFRLLPAGFGRCGEMGEWLKPRASKACIPERVSGVRIPLSPP